MPLTNTTTDGETFDLATILAKLKKVQALKDSTNPGEAANAAARFQQMLFRYNLQESQVTGWQEQQQTRYERQDLRVDGGWDVNLTWRRSLMHYICKFNFCDATFLTGTPKVAVIGRPENIQLCEYLFDYLSNEISRLCDEAYLTTNIVGSTKAWRNSFYRTLARQQKQDQEQAQGSGTALVRQSDAQLLAARDRLLGKVVKGQKHKIANAQGYYQGVEAGKNIRISDALNDSAHNTHTPELTHG
jgi:hypothetical protein